ncbi:MAG: macro domain-containing protein [Chloroflexota bacterium]|nr:macro domain-containing protein [Chloroflexota bacterium]
MIERKTGNLFDEPVEALVNSVNCVGVMGRGIALQFKNAFPANFKAYVAACKRDEVQPGRMFVFETQQMAGPRYIVNFPTKRHWRGKSRMEDIETGLDALAEEIRRRNIRSIALPPLGSGLGGLDWFQVRRLIETKLQYVGDCQVIIFEPSSVGADGRPNRSTNVPRMTAGRAVLVNLMHRYISGLLDPYVTLLEVHKLMYFMEMAGEPLNLNFQKERYGPYAEKLRHVLRTVEGHLVSGYADGGDAPEKQLDLVPGAVEDARAFLEGHPETQTRFGRVSELVEGFESSFGLELLSTVHWVATEHPLATRDELIDQTYDWDHRKRRFSKRQIRLAIRVLREKGWLESSQPGQA